MKPVAKIAFLLFPVFFLCLPASAASRLYVSGVRRAVSGPQLQFEGCYPRVDGICDAAGQNRLNVRLRETADSAEMNTRLAALRLAGSGQTARGSVGYQVRRNESGVFSVTVTGRFGAGNETSVRQTAYTVSTVSGRAYRLADFFPAEADYGDRLGNMVKEQIRSRGLERRLSRPFQSVEPDDNFYLTRDSLVLFYRQGDYFPQDCGVVEFVIPLSRLEGFMKADF